MFGIFSQLLDLIYKKRCYFCGDIEHNSKMCENCYKKIKFLPFKEVKKINNIPVYCVTLYNKEVQKMIRGVKYHNQKELAHYQACLMFDYWQKLETSKHDYIVVPVPLYKSREKKRKYNHMLLVAQEFAKKCGYEINNNLIKRVKNTKPQFNLSKKEREENLQNAFELLDGSSEAVKDKRILIMDDILTTGSTLAEMIETFNKGQIKKLNAFVTSCSEYNII